MTKFILAFSLLSTFFFFTPDLSLLDKLPAKAPGKIIFIGDAGSANEFTIEKWGFTKVENPSRPEDIIVEAILDMRSLKCNWKKLEQGVKKKKDYFFVKRFPEASIRINGATKIESNNYISEATVTIKGISKTVPIEFSISAQAPYTVSATTVIQRRDFAFNGDGPAEEVPVQIEAVLQVD